MGRKALQGMAHNMCQIFLGHQVWDDLPQLVQLGRGTLQIDVISGHCTKDEHHIEPLAMVEKLRQWLSQQLPANGLTLSDIEEAKLAVDYTVSEVAYTIRENAGHWWKWNRNRYCCTWDFHFRCRSTMRAFGHDYSSVAEGDYQLA